MAVDPKQLVITDISKEDRKYRISYSYGDIEGSVVLPASKVKGKTAAELKALLVETAPMVPAVIETYGDIEVSIADALGVDAQSVEAGEIFGDKSIPKDDVFMFSWFDGNDSNYFHAVLNEEIGRALARPKAMEMHITEWDEEEYGDYDPTKHEEMVKEWVEEDVAGDAWMNYVVNDASGDDIKETKNGIIFWPES